MNHIRCPHCDSAMQAEVTGCVESDGFWSADAVDIACTDDKCESLMPGPNDTQSLWQPIIDRIVAYINSRWHFGRVDGSSHGG